MASPAGAWLPRKAEPEPPRFPWQVIGVLVTAACLLFYLWLWIGERKPVSTALVLVPVLLVLSAPILVRIGRREPAFDLAGLLLAALSLRFIYSYIRLANAADASVYFSEGSRLAESFRALRFDVDTGRQVPGTGTVRYVTGLVNVATGSNEVATFLVFTWIAFWGLYLAYRAFELAVPDGDRYRYAKLVFFWPSLCFWPSSIGKEACLMLTLGVASLGVARVFTRRPAGYLLLFTGVTAASLVRPHIAMLALVAFVIALFVGRRHAPDARASTPASVAKVAGLVVLVVVASVFASRTADFFGTNDLSPASIDTVLTSTTEQTSQGGSAFTPVSSSSPQGYAVAFVTILVRPFPFEAHGAEELMTAAEGLVLAGLAIASWRRIASVPRRMRSQPYVGYAVMFLVIFVFVFASIANFGILARQRTQLLPFLFVLLSLPRPSRTSSRRPNARGAAPAA